ncbi:MAG TPA: alkaline phosphatase family protein [Thermoanaerobaculia bacterium]|nr:alkaline phosphatase family protein [Thermoanaerobaculia bacterium]
MARPSSFAARDLRRRFLRYAWAASSLLAAGGRPAVVAGHAQTPAVNAGDAQTPAVIAGDARTPAVIAGDARTPGDARASYTSPLPTGLRLDPVGEVVDLGSMPLAMALAPGGKQIVVLLAGWREQGIQVVDLASRRVTQTLPQQSAFQGLAFARDGRRLFVSGGNEDSVVCYSWRDGTAAFERKIPLRDSQSQKPGSRYPAGLAVSARGSHLYVAENESDTLAVIDLATSRVVQRLPTGHYPYAVEPAADGRIYVSAWGADTVAVFRPRAGGLLRAAGTIQVGPRPSALLANRSGSRLFVALAAADRVAVVDPRRRRVLGYLDDAAPAAPAEGSTPNALALSDDGATLFVAEADNNAVAVFDVAERRGSTLTASRSRPRGRIPGDWYPTAVLDSGGRLLILGGKGHGSHANPDGPTPGEGIKRPLGYDLGQLNGDLRIVPDEVGADVMAELTRRVAAANGWTGGAPPRKYPTFKHVVYIIKENRTYDQVLGDLKEGDGDPGLVFFGAPISPNHHALALRFGLFDRFFTNAEVSSQGHIWSTAAYVTDYGEKLIPSTYSDRRATVDGEDVDEPLHGFLWTLAKAKGISFRDYGEMVKVPEGWPVTQKDLVADISPTYPAFDLKIPDQARASAWIAELGGFVRDGEMPRLEVMHLPNDHTAGGRPGFRTPRALMADNDLALGRIVEALSRSPFWRDTVVFVLEDDSQAGPDHVDSHRSVFFAISAYNRPGTVHRFLNTTDVVAAIEDILGLDRLSKFDYFSRSLAELFAATPDLSPWTAIVPQVDMEEINAPHTAAARMSERLDLSAPDRVSDGTLNAILWRMMKGPEPLPAPRRAAPLHLLLAGR